MSDPVTRLNAALEGRYAIERELCHLPQRGAALAKGPLKSSSLRFEPLDLRTAFPLDRVVVVSPPATHARE